MEERLISANFVEWLLNYEQHCTLYLMQLSLKVKIKRFTESSMRKHSKHSRSTVAMLANRFLFLEIPLELCLNHVIFQERTILW